ncbi:hypothetical protein D9M68_405160 [compost metagenome]
MSDRIARHRQASQGTPPSDGPSVQPGKLRLLLVFRPGVPTVQQPYRKPKKLSTASMITTAPTSQTIFMATPIGNDGR